MTGYYLGKIREVIDRVTYEIRVDIDGVVEDKPAFPMRGEVDEPKVGDDVILRNVDPLYGSMYLYSKLKEDEYIGFRSNGKEVTITPESITMRVYKRGDKAEDDDYGSYVAKIVMKEDGTLLIESKSTLTVKSPDTVIKGPGILTVENPVTIPDPKGGPFCAFSVAPPPGTPMVSGYKLKLN